MALVECRTASHVIENYKAVRARVNAWKPWTPPVVVEVTAPPKPEPVTAEPVPAVDPTPAYDTIDVPEATSPDLASIIDPIAPWPKFPKVRFIQEVVAFHYGLKVFDLMSTCREARMVRPRQIAVYLCRKLTPHSYPQIGKRFGGRDHTTCMHAYRKITRLRGEDAKLDTELRELEEKLTVEKHEATPAPGTDCSACGL